MLILPSVWNFFWNASTAIVVTGRDEGERLEMATLLSVKDEVPTLAAVNMPVTANAGESIAKCVEEKSWYVEEEGGGRW